MNGIDREINKHRIVVIETLPQRERHTGIELYDSVLKYKCHFKKDVTAEYHHPDYRTDFEKILRDICDSLQNDEIATIHIESHGDERGFALASGDFIGWKDLFELTRPINIKCGHLLLLTMSMCKGGFGAIDIEPEKRAPFRAILGTPRIASDSDLLECFTIFYENYSNLLDAPKAYSLMNDYMLKNLGARSPFWLISAKKQFKTILNPPDDQIALKTLSREYRLLYLQRGISKTEEELKEKVKYILNNEYYRYKSFFNFEDIYKP